MVSMVTKPIMSPFAFSQDDLGDRQQLIAPARTPPVEPFGEIDLGIGFLPGAQPQRDGSVFVVGLISPKRDAGRQAHGAEASLLAAVPASLLASLPASLEKLKQFAVHRVVAGGDVALSEHGLMAVEVADETAGFAHEDDACCRVHGERSRSQ